MTNTRTIVTKAAGVTHDGRQSILAKLKGNEPCRIVPEPTNPYDKNALAIHVATADGVKHVGFVPRDLAAQIAPFLDGEAVMCEIIEIVGGFELYDGDTAALGLRIRITLPTLADEVFRETPDDYDLPHGDYGGEKE